MRAPEIVERHRSLRWLLPISGLALAAGAVSAMAVPRHASPALRSATAAALVAAARAPHVAGYSGTVVAQLSLGLPALTRLDTDEPALAALLNGSHTMQLWYGGADRQRVALLGPTSESDVFWAGERIWQWDSGSQLAISSVASTSSGLTPTIAALTPWQLAVRAFAAIGPSTTSTLSQGPDVADRAAYDLVLTPRQKSSRIGSVHVQVDGATSVPLGVQVYARGTAAAAIDVSFTSITFKRPPAGYFEFTPPPGATVRTGGQADLLGGLETAGVQLATTGAGWLAVAEFQTTRVRAELATGLFGTPVRPVSGAWGKGWLFESPLLCVLGTADGHVYAGAVDPSVLYAAAARR